MNKKLFLTIILGITVGFLIPLKLKAQETTPTASPTLDPKTKGVRDAVKEKIEEKLGEILSKQKKRGWIGIITDVSATGFKMKVNEETRTATLSDQATIINKNRQQIKFKDLAVDQRIIAMGYVQIDETLDARRIVLIGEREPRKTESIFGTIKEKAEQEKIVLVKNGEESYELIFDKNSVLEQRQDSETEEIDYEGLTVDQKLVAIISPTSGSTATYEVENLLIISSPEPTEEPETTETGETAPESTNLSPTQPAEE